MRVLLACTALLFAASASVSQAFEFRSAWPEGKPALECKRLADLREIIRAAVSGGIAASDKRGRRINEEARANGKPPSCRMIVLTRKLRMKAIEGYEAVESLPNLLSNVVILEVVGKDGITRYDAISRAFARGNAI